MGASNMQEKINKCEVKLNMQKQNSQLLGVNTSSGFDFPTPLINYDEEDKTESLRAQKQKVEEVIAYEPEAQKDSSDEAQKVEDEEPQQIKQNQVDHEETSDPHSDLKESVQRLESKCVDARSEEPLDIDLHEKVQSLESKCAGVREELGRMALSEQYMRTKQAQLRARKKELEAKEAMIKAELREKEAADMREKVQGMMKLLAERKNKLKITETVITKKANLVDNVNKIMNQKEIRVKQKQRQKDELLAFGKKPPK